MEGEESQTRKDIPSGQAWVQMLPAHPVILLYIASIGGGAIYLFSFHGYVCVLPKGMSVHHVSPRSPEEAIRSSWNRSHRWLGDTVCVLGTELWSPGREALNY